MFKLSSASHGMFVLLHHIKQSKMKTKFLFAAILLAGITLQTMAQNAVPQAAKTAFAKDHPGVTNPKWETEKGNFEANWKVSGMDHSALYSPAGKFISSETDIHPDDLPGVVKTYMAQHVHTKIKEASKNGDANGTITYEADVKGKAYIFDENGHFIRTAEDD